MCRRDKLYLLCIYFFFFWNILIKKIFYKKEFFWSSKQIIVYNSWTIFANCHADSTLESGREGNGGFSFASTVLVPRIGRGPHTHGLTLYSHHHRGFSQPRLPHPPPCQPPSWRRVSSSFLLQGSLSLSLSQLTSFCLVEQKMLKLQPFLAFSFCGSIINCSCPPPPFFFQPC